MAQSKISVPRYDTKLMVAEAIGKNGIAPKDLQRLSQELESVKKTLIEDWKNGRASFFALPDAMKDVRDSEEAARAVAKKAKTLIVAGIGGSDLGSRAFIDALGMDAKGMDVRFIGANTDPEELAALLNSVDLKKCALNVISKSGDTVEPMAAFLLIRKEMLKKMSSKELRERIVLTTGPDGGALHDIAKREGYRELIIPKPVGGRFSALTPVGLFPAACRGIPVKRLLLGAGAVRDAFAREDASENGPLLFAGLHVEAAAVRNQTIDVLMPYAESLRSFAFWYRQLWAESLGKARARDNREVYRGLTPIASLGATDQHSQLQLYNEGPVDKVITFIEVMKFRNDFRIPSAYKGILPAERLSGISMSEILHIEREATARTLATHGRPSGTLRIDKISPESIGGLMMFFMIATAAAAELLDINAYDQPGVEEGKQFINKALSKKR